MAKETKEVVEFLLALGESAALAFHDGEISLSDAVYLFDTLRRLGPALADLTKIPSELAAWQQVDTDELISVAEDFDIPQDHVEEAVKDAIKIAGPFVEFLAKFQRG